MWNSAEISLQAAASRFLCSRWPAGGTCGASGSTLVRPANRSTSRPVIIRLRRWRWPRTGTAESPPATATSTASTVSRLRGARRLVDAVTDATGRGRPGRRLPHPPLSDRWLCRRHRAAAGGRADHAVNGSMSSLRAAAGTMEDQGRALTLRRSDCRIRPFASDPVFGFPTHRRRRRQSSCQSTTTTRRSMPTAPVVLARRDPLELIFSNACGGRPRGPNRGVAATQPEGPARNRPLPGWVGTEEVLKPRSREGILTKPCLSETARE